MSVDANLVSKVHTHLTLLLKSQACYVFTQWMIVKVKIFEDWELVGGRFFNPQPFLSWGLGPSPALWDVPAQINSTTLSSCLRLPSPLWGNGNVVIGGPGEWMRKAAFTFSGLKSHPSSSGTLFSIRLQIPADSSPSFSPLPLTHGHGYSGLDCGDNLDLNEDVERHKSAWKCCALLVGI